MPLPLPSPLETGAAMALAASLAELHAEARCPVCRDFLQEPITLECGHNCCASCLQQRWEHLQDVLPCPVCLHPCTHGHPQRNTQLGNMVDLVQQLRSKRLKVAELVEEEEEEEGEEEEGRGLCERHQQVLSLFCEDDLELLCTQCGESPEHQAHDLMLIEDAAAHHRQRLKSCLGRLGKQLEEAETILLRQVWEEQGWREKVEERKRDLVCESEHLKYFLKIEEDVLENELSRQMTGFSKKIIDRQTQLSDIGSTLKSLLKDILGLRLETDLALLRGAGHMHRQWRQWGGLELPATFSYQFMEPALLLPPHFAGLHNLKDHFLVHLTLDPDTAHSSLSVSQDQKTVSFHRLDRAGGPTSGSRPKAFTSLEAILGMQSFEGGRHFWQVEIQGSGMWSLGVCMESFPRNAVGTTTPGDGCWQLQQFTGVILDSQQAQTRVGVFLDYDLEKVAFYNLVNCSHFCTLNGSFSGKLLPYFGLCSSSIAFSVTLV
ncbi:tripartite motif-containing protein 75-like [Suncus etruscus]|uniref:tripartite motif-containing protein 75-like n=1 Tax=Suncus etruscus TaxID=109475 RepID=UPI00210F962B|nr:tripartite motif-containing protein 75-like [Suncus etruscus]